MRNKKGQSGGDFIVNFIATIIIVILLMGFVFISNMVRISSGHSAGETVFKEDLLGITDGVGYMENYAKLVEARSASRGGFPLDRALHEVNYER